jgi:hypothetical protein
MSMDPSFFRNSVTQRTLNNSNMAYSGEWSFHQNASGTSYHLSNTAGDRAQIPFQGVLLHVIII